MNTKDFLRLGVPLPPSLRYGATTGSPAAARRILLPNSSSAAQAACLTVV